jgi:hypothetical protein
MRWIEASSAIICFRFVDRRSAGRHQVGFHPRERLKELFAIRIEDAAKRLGSRRFIKRLCGEKQRAAGLFQEQLPGAPFGSVLPTLDQAALREPIEDAYEGNRTDLKQFAKINLMDTLILPEISDRLPLRAGYATISSSLFETLPIKAHDVIEQKVKRRMNV